METQVPKFLVLQETRLEHKQEEEKIARTFFEKLEFMKKERVKGEDLQLENIPKLGEK